MPDIIYGLMDSNECGDWAGGGRLSSNPWRGDQGGNWVGRWLKLRYDIMTGDRVQIGTLS